MKIAAIIVSRKDSVRIQYKSRQKIKDQNLVERKISQLKKVKSLDSIYLGTNDLSLKKLSKKYKINFVKRENKFCDEKKTSANDMIKNMLKFVDADLILWAHPTNPFINHEIYEKAIRLFKKSSKKFDSLFSATIVKNHFWNNKKKPINHNPFSKKHIVASKLPTIFSQNGGIFIRFKNDMMKDGRFIGNKPYIFPVNEIEGWDLDYPWQLELARTLVKFKYTK
jgi:CMP-N,N'-diacetyllegionaminic acid synthase|tara:strand:+ start:1487 stop:2158 length:672 start_codon:yes stop_codon:yes gene_type:complete